MLKTANKISFLVDQQLPDFINEEYELFGKFIQKYYEQLEISGQPLDIVTNLSKYRDIDLYEQNILKQSTTVVGLVSDTDTSITVDDASSFPEHGGYIKIDDEILFYKSRTDTQFLEISRGVSGNTQLGDLYSASTFVTTQATSHTNGSAVQNISNLFLYAFIKNFENEYLQGFPEEYLNNSVDKRTLIKNISSFYKSKGTDKSIKFLFKCLIDNDPEPEVLYPRDFTLKSSDSNWVNNYSIKVKILSGTVTDLIGKRITQTSGTHASAIVDNVRYDGKYDGDELYEIILNEASVNGEFSIATKTKLRDELLATTQVGDRIKVESTLGWNSEGEFIIDDEIITFKEKTVNTFTIASRTGTGVFPIGTSVTYGSNVSGANVTMLVYGVLYNADVNGTAPYSNVGDILEISEPGFVTNDIRIVDAQNSLRWNFTSTAPKSNLNASLSSTIGEFESNVAAIYEDGEGYYIASSGWPSHDIISAGSTIPSNIQDQNNLKIIRKRPISITETYETKYRDIGIAVNGIPFLGYKDEDVVYSGALQKIVVNTRGTGYTEPPFVLVDGASNAAISNLAGQVVESVSITNTGDYSSIPVVEIVSGRNATATAVVTNGKVTSINITNAGEFYSSPPVVRITDNAGKGRFAEFTSVISSTGAVTELTLINAGNYYSQENIQVDIISVGSGATASANIKEWRKDKYFINKNNLDNDNGYFFKNFNDEKGYGYAYYASPSTLRANDTGATHSPILGYAYDGNPIYGAYGYTDPLDVTSALVRMTSSFPKNSDRDGGPSITTYPLGTFINDYTFVDGYGSLDINNGRFCVTPEYPNGTYAYFITVDSSDTPIFPYILGKNYYSLPLDSNYNSNISQYDLPISANRYRSSGISKNGDKTYATIKDVSRGTVSSATVISSNDNFSVGNKIVVDDTDSGGYGASGEVDSVKGKTVTSIESQETKVLFFDISNTAYVFDGDTITQTVTGATGKIVGNVFSGNRFVLRDVTGTFNSTDVLSSNTNVLNLILDTNSSYTKGAILSLSDGVNAAVATGEVLETTTSQNSVKVKVLTGTFNISNTLFLTSSDLINSTGSKIVSISSLSENLIIFNIKDNVALMTTSTPHGVAVGEKINININPDDSTTTTTYHVRKRIYQEAIVKIPVISRVLSDSGVGRISIINGGGDYTAAEYKNVVLNGGAGEDAKATIVVSAAGLVNSVTITDKGKNYKKFDILSVSGTALSKAGSSTKPDLKILVDHVGLSADEVVLTVDSSIGFTDGDYITIGSEILKINQVLVDAQDELTNKLNVARGQKSTIAVDHFDGSTVSVYDNGFNIPVGHSLGTDAGDADVISYTPSTQKLVVAWDYDLALNTINDITSNTVFYDNSTNHTTVGTEGKKLVEISSFTSPLICFEFSSDNTTFTRNPNIDIKEYYKYKFDTSHSSMIGVGFDISPSKNFNLVTPERIINSDNLDIKIGYGSRVSTNNYDSKQSIPYRRYYYYDRDGIVQSQGSYLNVINDPLQGEKDSLYTTSTSILYSTGIKATHDGNGSINYTSKSLFSVGEINSIKIINIGVDYNKVPIITGVYNSLGNVDSTAKCYLNSDNIGIPLTISIDNNGGSYHNDQTIKSTIRSNYILVLSNFIDDAFTLGETIVQKSGSVETARARVTSWRKGSNILVVDRIQGSFRENQSISGLARRNTATIVSIDYCDFNPIIKTYFDNLGEYKSDYGKISDANQKIHDSYYYQDYSYLIKSKTPINIWRQLIKETTHPAGFKLFGEVLIESTGQSIMSSNTNTSRISVLQLWDTGKNIITVQSTRRQITQHIISTQSTVIEQGVGSVALDSANTSEVKSTPIKLTPAFDGSLSNKGNLIGRKTFNILNHIGDPITPYNNQTLTITLDGILQEPGVAYTVSGSQITFAQPPLGPVVKDGQEVPGVRFYGKHYQFKRDSLNERYFRKIRNIFQKGGRWIDASNQIDYNREFIQSETIGYLKDKYTSITWNTTEAKCFRDIGLIIDAVSHDIRFGGNQSSVESAEKYFNNGLFDYIQGEIVETIDGYEYAINLAKKAVNNQLTTGAFTTVEPYSNNNIIVDTNTNKCADVISALETLFGVIKSTMQTGVGTVAISRADYIDGKNKIFELYYEDGTGVATEANENLFIALSGVLQHDSAYSIDRTSVPNKVVFTSPPLWGQSDNTKTLQEPLAVDKFFAHSIGNYLRCEVDKYAIPDGSPGPFVILDSNSDVVSIDDSKFVLVFIDGVLQRDKDSYIINGPTITFSRNIFSKNNVEIIYLYGRDLSQSITLYDYDRNRYYNEIVITCDAGSPNDFAAWKNWFGATKDAPVNQVAYQKIGGKKRFIGNVRDYTTTNQSLIITIAGHNPDMDSSNIFFSRADDYSNEYELTGTTDTVNVIKDGLDHRLQRDASSWLYGTKRADEAFYEKSKNLANLNQGDLIKINGEDDWRTIKELPQYLSSKTYVKGDDPSNNFYGSVNSTNYSGDTFGVGLSVTCTISNGKVDSLSWDRNAPKGYNHTPILHFIPLDQNGGGARAEVIVKSGSVVDIVLTDGGSGYTKAPKINVAKQYDLIKKRGRKIDPFVTLNVKKDAEVKMCCISVEWRFEKPIGGGGPPGGGGLPIIPGGPGGPGSAIVADIASSLTVDFDSHIQITSILDPVHVNSGATLAVLDETCRYWPTYITSVTIPPALDGYKEKLTAIISPHISVLMGLPTFYIDANGNRRVNPGGPGGGGGFPPGGGGGDPGDPTVGKTTVYELGFVDHRFFNTPAYPSIPALNNTTLRPTFMMWENAKFMDTGNITSSHSGLSVSAYTVEEFNRYGFDLADFLDNARSGFADAGYAFNIGYPTINYYLTQLQTSDLPDENGGGYVATNGVVYVQSTTNFPSTGTILIGKEQISYTGKLSDRFTGCTRGVNGSPIVEHTIGDFLRSA